MSNRLLTLLSDIERSIISNDPSPDGGTWDTLRLINFHQGLARLTLSVRSPAGLSSPRGIILLQHFTLADETQCVKANLSWQGAEKSSVYAIYSKPQMNWHSEAAQIGTQWLDGWLTVAEAHAAVASEASPLLSAAS